MTQVNLSASLSRCASRAAGRESPPVTNVSKRLRFIASVLKKRLANADMGERDLWMIRINLA
jgi:hypothetical protein